MTDINTALNASNDAIQQLLLAGERTRTAWASPRAPGSGRPARSWSTSRARSRSRPTWRLAVPPSFQSFPQSFTPSSGACCSSGC